MTDRCLRIVQFGVMCCHGNRYVVVVVVVVVGVSR